MREASRLRATLGSEPSSGYAFHDQVRVERARPGQRDTAPQVASHAPRERAFAQTLVGGVTIQEALAGLPLMVVEPAAPPENDQRDDSGRASWPPLPQVPSELAGSVADADVPTGVRQSAAGSVVPAKAETRADSLEPTKPGSGPPAVPAGGAIWQAMPSLVDTQIAIESSPSRQSAPPRHSAPMAKPQDSPPAGFRPSAAELEAEQSHAYGDQRVLKYEGLVERNAWEQLAEELSRERDLSPALLLLSVVAARETLKGDQKQEAARLAQRGISAMAKILNLPEASPTALVLGKRLLRRNPAWIPKQEASVGLSFGLLLAGVAAGGAIGWLITRLLF